MNQQPVGLTVRVHGPSGDETPARLPLEAPVALEAVSYKPPSRDHIAKVVEACETELNNSSDSPNGESPVGALLRDASEKLGLYSDGNNRNKTYFPHGLLVEVLTKDRIASSLFSPSKEAKGYTLDECYRRIRGSGEPNELGEYARIFAVLLLCDVPEDIFKFFNPELRINDAAFPFERAKKSGSIRSRSWGADIPDFRPGWKTTLCESFTTQQWRVFLPRFTDTEEHLNFDGDTIMPWHDYHVQARGSSTASTGGGMDAPAGGNSVVNRVFIHDDHWSFHGLNPVSH